jgi:hypothetical protein
MKQQLIEIIKQALQEQPKQDCGCGCGNCGKAVRLNESKQYDAPISEGLRYHINNKLTLQDTIYRPGSKAHIELVHEARLLWKQGVINLSGIDKQLFENTDLGKFGIYESQVVPLDFPIMEVEKIPGGLAQGMSIEDIAMHHYSDIIFNYSPPEINKLFGISSTLPPPTKEEFFNYIKNQLAKGIKVEMEHTTDKEVAKEIAMDHIYEDPKYYDKLSKIEEAELEEEKKQPALGKPKRGGSKKFYVYVKDPKTKRIKKVSFGMAGGGLRAKLNNPKARQAFAKRHDCANKKDRTKASYWSCALPRYAKLLGFKTTFSGYW